ncbi:hypothetical protein PJL18_04283 [Paenarthrobacter nicotinovorans]|nr:hypothetical protein [Paenarthrobacter nicotinovorans]
MRTGYGPDTALENLLERRACDPTTQLLHEDSDAERVVAERCTGLPQRGQRGEPRRSQRRVVDLVQGQASLGPQQSGLMGQELRNRDRGFAFDAEFGPVLDHLGVKVQLAVLHQQGHDQARHTLGTGEHSRDGVGADMRPPTQVQDFDAAMIRGHLGGILRILGQETAEEFGDGFETGGDHL